MKYGSSLLMLLWVNTITLSAQKKIESSAAASDFKIFENILRTGHPNLTEYIPKDSLDLLFEITKDSIAYQLTDIGLFKKMLNITNGIKDGNLSLYAPNTIKTDQYHFPLILKIINTQLFTDTDDFGIPIGSKINTINGRKTSRILEGFKKYTAADGYILTKKYRDVESKFGKYYAYEYGIEKEFTITYTEPTGIEKTSILAADSFVKVKLRSTKRSSYFGKYHQKMSNITFYEKHINSKEPFVYYKEDLLTAVLVVNSFSTDIRAFQSQLAKIFKEINKKKLKHLVIDVRNNNGGFRPNAIHLYSFITKNAFKQIVSGSIVSLSVPERKHTTHTFLNEKEFLKDKFKNHPTYDGWRVTFDDLETIMVPDRDRFIGKVYVLIGGNTSSTAATFALNAKNNPDITLIGEEAGGGYYTSNSMFPVYYELPNSKIVMVMFMEKIDWYTKDKTLPKGSGIPPDKYISLSVDDLIRGKDPLLDYIFRLIKGEK